MQDLEAEHSRVIFHDPPARDSIFAGGWQGREEKGR